MQQNKMSPSYVDKESGSDQNFANFRWKNGATLIKFGSKKGSAEESDHGLK